MFWLLAFILLSGAVSFTAGILLPLLQMDRLYFFTETPSLLQIIVGLMQEGDLLLGLLVAGFSLVFPLVKFFVLFVESLMVASVSDNSSKFFKHISMLSKWSMMDVLLVALVIFAAKTSGFAEAITQMGIWFYSYAVLASAVGASLIKRMRAKIITT